MPIMKHIYIFGGLVESPYDQREHVANKEMWKFNTGHKKWTGPLVSILKNDILSDDRVVIWVRRVT